MSDTTIHKGLDGVVVDSTSVSKVMPETNSLTYRGYAVQTLCATRSFEDVAYLLLYGELPTAAQRENFVALEKAQRALSPRLLEVLAHYPKTAHPMDAIRTSVSFLGMEDDAAWVNTQEDLLRKAIALLAKIPTAVAAAYRLRQGKEPIAPDTSLTFAENFFHMCFGQVPEKPVVECFDTSLILYAEHSFNASTFTARVITSSLPDIYGAVCGAIASLKGPLHGGANEAVMEYMQEIGTVENAEPWIRDAIANKKVVMGFGHRVYKSGDSRVPTMTEAFKKVAALRDGDKWVKMSETIADIFINEKNIHPNLDYPAGPAYYLMGFDIDIYTPIFVMARITGWTAHIMEQFAANKLIRPLSDYTGHPQRDIPTT